MRRVVARLFLVAALLGGTPGCPGGHVAERAANAASATGYSLELDKCVDEAYAVLNKEGGDAASAAYGVCAAKADAKYGVVR